MYDYSYSHAQSLINDYVRKERTYIDKNALLYYDWFEKRVRYALPICIAQELEFTTCEF